MTGVASLPEMQADKISAANQKKHCLRKPSQAMTQK
jgi:hypothetical protein